MLSFRSIQINLKRTATYYACLEKYNVYLNKLCVKYMILWFMLTICMPKIAKIDQLQGQN